MKCFVSCNGALISKPSLTKIDHLINVLFEVVRF